MPLPYDGYPQIWNSSNLQVANDIGVHRLPFIRRSFFADSERVLTSSGGRTIKVWNARSAPSQQVVKRMDQRIIDFAMSANGNRSATVDIRSDVSVVDITQKKILAQLASHHIALQTAMSPDGKFLLTALDTVSLAAIDVDTNSLHSTFDAHSSMVNCVAISPSGKHFASASWDGNVFVWNPNTSDVINISHSRAEAIDRYARFAESLRALQQLQSETSPDDVAKAGGIVLAGNVSEQDREQLIQSGIALQDVIVRLMNEPVTDAKTLIADVEGLVENLQSEQVSEFEVEVRRGQFRQVKINNVVN